MAPKIAIIYYSLYGHIARLVQDVAKGARAAGAEVELFQFPETWTDEMRAAFGAPPRDNEVPNITVDKLLEFDGYIFGIPTRYGRPGGQVSSFFDQTGGHWASQALNTKFATIITSTNNQHGGQELIPFTTLPFLAHHGIIFVPLGYKEQKITNMGEITGGSPWGASTLADRDGSRQPSKNELEIAVAHGQHFASVVGAFVRGKQIPPALA